MVTQHWRNSSGKADSSIASSPLLADSTSAAVHRTSCRTHSLSIRGGGGAGDSGGPDKGNTDRGRTIDRAPRCKAGVADAKRRTPARPWAAMAASFARIVEGGALMAAAFARIVRGPPGAGPAPSGADLEGRAPPRPAASAIECEGEGAAGLKVAAPKPESSATAASVQSAGGLSPIRAQLWRQVASSRGDHAPGRSRGTANLELPLRWEGVSLLTGEGEGVLEPQAEAAAAAALPARTWGLLLQSRAAEALPWESALPPAAAAAACLGRSRQRNRMRRSSSRRARLAAGPPRPPPPLPPPSWLCISATAHITAETLFAPSASVSVSAAALSCSLPSPPPLLPTLFTPPWFIPPPLTVCRCLSSASRCGCSPSLASAHSTMAVSPTLKPSSRTRSSPARSSRILGPSRQRRAPRDHHRLASSWGPTSSSWRESVERSSYRGREGEEGGHHQMLMPWMLAKRSLFVERSIKYMAHNLKM